jgi:hypothetical protein
MSESPEPQPVDPALVKYLRILVTVLTVTMIAGFLVIIALFVTKFSVASGPALPDQITLPDGTAAQAFTSTRNWFAIVTTDNRILIYDLGGDLLQSIDVPAQQ